eukprot:TRINITY_DN37724_c0_g1_i1.p1 TRINITY_DN37724_c0_g1~~TRINITY_DN37724_c0_g1_i1.p1  ORF type:complete len:199 (-),score=19.82 TRINITY_DN37724_c0_g1_i1:76-672(-)
MLHNVLQKSFRNMFLKCSSKLDLSDPTLRPAVERVQKLIHKKKKKCVSDKQWSQIKGVLKGGSRSDRKKRFPTHPLSAAVTEEGKKKFPVCGIPSKAEGCYTPSERVRGSQFVHQGEGVSLTCSKCDHRVVSSWYLTYQGKEKLLIPVNGHSACGHAKYLVPPGMAYMRCTPSRLPCEHGYSTSRNCPKSHKQHKRSS